MDLLLERGRMYLHGAAGRFGAVPITITGDMDLNPEMGTYRWGHDRAAVQVLFSQPHAPAVQVP